MFVAAVFIVANNKKINQQENKSTNCHISVQLNALEN